MSLFETSKPMDGDTKYSRAIKSPQYTPKNTKPHIASLTDTSRYIELVRNINQSSVSEEEKAFLKLAASRHIVFRYALIADYYANATKEMQELMEQSALVILDIDDAVKYGYVKLSDRMSQLIEEAKEYGEE